jgi:hypothetical protein
LKAPGTCEFIRISPYWFYSFEPGKGPSVAMHDIMYDGTIRDVSNTKKGVPVCGYDYSAEGGPNCCEGAYENITNFYASDGTFSSRSNEALSWGGRAGNCLAGPAMQSQILTSEGFPRATIYASSETGIETTYDIAAPRINALKANVSTVNFYKPSEHAGGRPAAMRIPRNIDSLASQYQPNDSYTMECLDKSKETIKRIRLQIREWNSGPIIEGGNPDLEGTEPGNPGEAINDFKDWKDFGETFPASDL